MRDIVEKSCRVKDSITLAAIFTRRTLSEIHKTDAIWRYAYMVHIIHNALTIYAFARGYPLCGNIPIGPVILPIED